MPRLADCKLMVGLPAEPEEEGAALVMVTISTDSVELSIATTLVVLKAHYQLIVAA